MQAQPCSTPPPPRATHRTLPNTITKRHGNLHPAQPSHSAQPSRRQFENAPGARSTTPKSPAPGKRTIWKHKSRRARTSAAAVQKLGGEILIHNHPQKSRTVTGNARPQHTTQSHGSQSIPTTHTRMSAHQTHTTPPASNASAAVQHAAASRRNPPHIAKLNHETPRQLTRCPTQPPVVATSM